MNIIEFQKNISEANKPVIVDFWADWCVPCKITKPILEKVAEEYKDKVQFMPIDADVSRDVLEKFKIISIPTVLALKDGEIVDRLTGAQNETVYRAMFDALAEGKEIKVSVSSVDRALRLGAGALLAISGISSSNWLVVGIGAVIAFLGIYDRCPIWRAITGMIRSKIKN